MTTKAFPIEPNFDFLKLLLAVNILTPELTTVSIIICYVMLPIVPNKGHTKKQDLFPIQA